MESGNDYVIQVKGNQRNLYNAIKVLIEYDDSIDRIKTLDQKRGRQEYRDIAVYKSDNAVLPFSKWPGLNTIIHVQRHGIRNQKSYHKDHYYISSLTNTEAVFYARGIRSHWGIENRLHWVKDVILNEDKSRIRSGKITRNLSIVKSTVINLFRLNGYPSVKKAIEQFANRPKQASILLENIHIKKFRTV